MGWFRKSLNPTVPTAHATAAGASAKDRPGFVKVFASPGVDSHPNEQGVFTSGAAFDPGAPTLKTPPYDWFNEAPEQGYAIGHLVGPGLDPGRATAAPQANHLGVRKRGVSPWGGFMSEGGRSSLSMQHVGGNVDHNAGASSLIAGGPGSASSLVRINRGGPSRGMKLPLLPQAVKRGGMTQFPAGGGSHDNLAAPLKPMVPGFVSIFQFRNMAKQKAIG